MKKFTLITAALALLTPTIIFAEPPAGEKGPGGADGKHERGGRRMDPEARLKMLTEKLSLTEDQQAKVKAIYEKSSAEFKAMREKGRENLTEEDKTKMREWMKAQQEEVAAILTPEQKEKMKEWREKRREGRGGEGRKDRKKGDGKPGEGPQ